MPVLAKADPVALKAGQKAPEDGVFYSNDAHAKLVAKIKTDQARHEQELEYWKRKLKLEMDTALKLKDVSIDILNQKLTLTIKAAEAREKFLLGEAVKAQTIPWYKSPTFVAVTTVVLTIGVGAFAVWGVDKLRK